MKLKNLFPTLSAIIIGLAFFILYSSIKEEGKILSGGKLIKGVVTKLPATCFGNNDRINVQYLDKIFYILISNTDCNTNKYRVGDTVICRYLNSEAILVK